MNVQSLADTDITLLAPPSAALDRVPAASFPATHDGEGPLLLWRSWIVAPEQSRGADSPVLTGVYGFLWRGPELDAKCTLRDWDQATMGVQAKQLERHHPVIPDPGCTCGIYALTAEATDSAGARLPRGRPTVSGFVELSGRLIRRGTQVRARHARVVGPLALSPGRIPLLADLLRVVGTQPRPRRVHAHPCEYRVLWSGKGAGMPFADWEEKTRALLEARYGVPVVALGDGR